MNVNFGHPPSCSILNPILPAVIDVATDFKSVTVEEMVGRFYNAPL